MKEVTEIDVSLPNKQMADMALYSFLKVIAKINKFSHIL